MNRSKPEINHTILSEGYVDRIMTLAGPVIAAAIDQPSLRAPLIGDREHSVAYAIVTDPETQTVDEPIMLINGFLAGKVANGAFAALLHAQTRRPVILSEQYDGTATGLSAVAAQANAYASIIEKARLKQTPLDVVTHSLGSLILEKLLTQAERKKWSCFSETNVLLMAPAGLRDETLTGFTKRYAKLMSAGSTMEKFPDGFWDFEAEMFAAGQNNFKSHPLRTLREGRAVMRGRLDLPKLSHRVGRLGIMPFHEDVLFGDGPLQTAFSNILADAAYENVSILMPFSAKEDGHGKLISARGSDHNDHQFNPGRVAPAVAQFLRG